jgi:TRAP-type C4-dicarboxylate transport system substrate-binding protein
MKMRLFYLAFLSLLFPAGGADAQQLKLKANLQTPAFTTYGMSMVRFKEEVERRSKNAITIEIFDKAQLYRDEEVVDAVSSGAVDIGTTATQQFTHGAPAVHIIDLPFLFNFRTLVDAAASPDSEIRRLIDEAVLDKLGVRVLWWQPLGDTVFYSKGRDVADPERLKEQRVAVPSKSLEELIRRCGGLPTSLSVQKFRQAIEGGTLDMAMASFAAFQTLDLSTVTDTITYTAHAPLAQLESKSWCKRVKFLEMGANPLDLRREYFAEAIVHRALRAGSWCPVVTLRQIRRLVPCSGGVPRGSLETELGEPSLSFDRRMDASRSRTGPSTMCKAFYTYCWPEVKGGRGHSRHTPRRSEAKPR